MSAGEDPRFEDSVRDLEGAFGRLVRQYRRILSSQAQKLDPGLSLGAMKAFITLCNQGPMTPSALAEQLLLDRAQVSRMARDLEAAGLIRRDPDPVDRRSARLSATEEGRARLDTVRGGPAGLGPRRDLAQWEIEEIDTLTTLLIRFMDQRQERLGGVPDGTTGD